MAESTPHPHQALLAEARAAASTAHVLSVQDRTIIADAGILQRCRDVLRQLADALEAATRPEPQPDAQGRIHDPDLYARLSKPRPMAEVKASIAAFGAEVRAARNRHGLCDVVIAILTPVEGETTTNTLAVLNNGDSRLRATILALALGHVRQQEAADLDRMASGESEASRGE